MAIRNDAITSRSVFRYSQRMRQKKEKKKRESSQNNLKNVDTNWLSMNDEKERRIYLCEIDEASTAAVMISIAGILFPFLFAYQKESA